jgi:hypothetical protein
MYEEWEWCVWWIYANDYHNKLTKKEVEATIAMLKQLDAIVIKNSPNLQHFGINRA